jgi:hypothetical protein
MMIKRRMNDTTRKNAPRSSVIMMTHSLCWLGRQAFLLVPRPACMIDPQRPEFAPITMPTDAVKISINLPNMMEEFYPDSHHYIVAGRLRICNISTSCLGRSFIVFEARDVSLWALTHAAAHELPCS